MIKKVKNAAPWTNVINEFNGKKLLEHSMRKNCKTQIKSNLELKK